MAGWKAGALWSRVGKVLCGRSQVFGQAVASLVAALTYVTALPPPLAVPPIPVMPCQVDIVNSASISSVTITEQSWKSNLPNTFLDVGSFDKLPSA